MAAPIHRIYADPGAEFARALAQVFADAWQYAAQQAPPDRLTVSVAEACRLTDMSEPLLRDFIREHGIRTLRAGRKRLISYTDLVQAIDRLAERPSR
jgi:excisionase family DNA binding protein